MIKELKEMLDELEELDKTIDKRLQQALKDKVIISVEKDETGKSTIKTEGERLAILVTLAGLEQAILRNTKTPNEIWEFVKDHIGSIESENE